jgi:hypothetical protein
LSTEFRLASKRRAMTRRGFLGSGFLFGLPLVGAGSLAARTRGPDVPRTLVIRAHPFAHFDSADRARRQFGALTFLGGLELRADDPEFGGISSGRIDADGAGFIALTDHAHWITGRFVEEAGALTGIADARIAPMLNAAGRRLKDTRQFDSESMARAGRWIYVGVERTHDILRFDFAAQGLLARGHTIPVPPEMKQLRSNAGIEALGVIPAGSPYAGSLLALAEKAPRDAPTQDNPGFIIGSKPGKLHVRKIGDFDITDLDFLPGGDMLMLERRFVPFFGLGFRIRRIAQKSIQPGALLDGPVLIEANLGHQIDNMEALMVHRAADGRIILTVMSDDNFSILQRTLVLRFALNA